jgi:hypothetical protein
VSEESSEPTKTPLGSSAPPASVPKLKRGSAARPATADGLEISTPRKLFQLDARPPLRLDAYSYDVLPDGRFVVNRLIAEPSTSTFTIVLNWTARPRRQ